MGRVRETLRQLMGTQYTRSLEAEIARLRAENRALLNSILGVAGVPPITVSTDEAASEHRDVRRSAVGAGSGLDAAGVARLRGMGARNGTRRVAPSVTAPVRRRSWHQINQALEIDSARTKERQTADGPELGVAIKSS
ncbi:MAG TPA: hypothetical protein VFW94_12530 [Candidatus Acidoferrales bacterium]|nr:hypothetical protein [Candidatus Acidoferrales bacterium]